MTVPLQKPGRSEQVVCTPPAFLGAVKRRLGITAFARDLAATPDNTVAMLFYTEGDNALEQSWRTEEHEWNWCNPPFGDIEPWVQQAHGSELGQEGNTAMLLPASVGANWFRDHVAGRAKVLFLNGRLTFVGHTSPYPKDLMLCLYGAEPGYEVWDWRTS